MSQDQTEGKDASSPTLNTHIHLILRHGNCSPISKQFLLVLPHPFEPRQFETDLRRIKNKIMWSTCLIKNLAWKTEMNIQVLSQCCEEDTYLLTFNREELLRTWLTPVNVDFSYFSWHYIRKSDALLFSLPPSVRSVAWTVSSSKLRNHQTILSLCTSQNSKSQLPN